MCASGSPRCPSAHHSPATAQPLSERSTNLTKTQSAVAALLERADFLRPQYLWAPLHTSHTQGVLDDHEALIRWHGELMHLQQRRGNGGKAQTLRRCKNYTRGVAAARIAWQAVAESRAVELREFIAQHRSMYGDLDAEPLARIEACLLRLDRCLLHAPRKMQIEKLPHAQQSSVGGGRSQSTRGATVRAKRITFAHPVFQLFFSSPPPKCLGGTEPKEENGRIAFSAGTEERSEHYQGRTSGVYYGCVSHPVSSPLTQPMTSNGDEALEKEEEEERWQDCVAGAEVTEAPFVSPASLHHSYDFALVDENSESVVPLAVYTLASLEAMAASRRMGRTEIYKVRLLWIFVLLSCLVSFVLHWKSNQG